MTIFTVEHAVVMDTDDLPGRGGYAVVGVSSGVSQTERAFVAQNFGISDYLHDPKLQTPEEHRVFYSFFRVPGSRRRALVRRFAKGMRRNQTQNRLFVHTLFIDDDLFERFEGLPWLLINATLRAEGASAPERLTDDVPWGEREGSLPRLQWDDGDGAADDVSDSLRKRLALLAKQLPEGAPATVITALSRQPRVVLPQGRAHELLTMLAWSLLPWRDREEIAWTQHDTLNLSGVTFGLANAVMSEAGSISLEERRPSPFALEIVSKTASEESWRDFQQRARNADPPLTVRDARAMSRWLDWRKGVGHLELSLDKSDAEVVEAMDALVALTHGQLDAPWIDRKELLQLVWQKVSDAVASDKEPGIAVSTWVGRLMRSGLDGVIFRAAPERGWLAGAAEEVGADLLLQFFLKGTGEEAETARTRDAIAAWVVEESPAGVSTENLADVAIRAANDDSPSKGALFERLLSTDRGLKALVDKYRNTAAEPLFVALPIVLRHRHRHAIDFIRNVLVEHLRVAPASRARMTGDLAREAAEFLRDKPADFVDFAKCLTPEAQSDLAELVTQWLYAQKEQMRELGRGMMPLAGPNAAPLAIALANAGEPATTWFPVLLKMAETIDATRDPSAAAFQEAVKGLGSRRPNLAGALDRLTGRLRSMAASQVRPGECIRALIMLLRPEWRTHPADLVSPFVSMLNQAALSVEWEPVLGALVDDLGNRSEVSALAAAYWLNLDNPRAVPNVDRRLIHAIAYLSSRNREAVAERWRDRLRQIPEGESYELLFDSLYRDRAQSPEIVIQVAQREIDQRKATFDTLNQLDRAFYVHRPTGYEGNMADAMDRYAGSFDRVERLRKICELLSSAEVDQTVKRIAEARVLPGAAARLKRSEWLDAVRTFSDDQLFSRGVPRLTLARAIGRGASDDAISTYESACRDGRFDDALCAVAVGRGERGNLLSRVGTKVLHAFGFD